MLDILDRSLLFAAILGTCVSCGASGPLGSANDLNPPPPPKPEHNVVLPTPVDASACQPIDPGTSLELAHATPISLGVIIGADGRVSDSVISESSGQPDLDRALMSAVQSCSYRPATIDGVPIPIIAGIRYAFSSPLSAPPSLSWPRLGSQGAKFPLTAFPRIIQNYPCFPPYPEASLQARETGTITIRLLIGVSGRALNTEVVVSSGFPRLDLAAVTTFENCPFLPGEINGKAAPMFKYLRYGFAIND